MGVALMRPTESDEAITRIGVSFRADGPAGEASWGTCIQPSAG